MVSDKRIKEFQEAVKKDCGADVNFEEAGKILRGITGYLLILEKIYLRMQNKENK